MLSIIIPAYNEAEKIAQTIQFVKRASALETAEIIVIDGGSGDDTVSIAKQMGVQTYVSEKKGRGAQMNKGAYLAKGPVLYFLHADSIPPRFFDRKIVEAIDEGYSSGCFRLAFDYQHWFLKLNCWFTRFNINAVRFGDQSLFVKKNVFIQSGGFREDLMLMEDQEIIYRLKKSGKFIVLQDAVITSARKYLSNGIYRLQGIFFILWLLYYLGYSQEKLVQFHKKHIANNKL